MAFSDFDLRTVVDTFGLQEERDTDLFSGIAPREPSEHLRAWLEEYAQVAVGMNTEQARSIYLIAPILTEAKRHVQGPVQVFPGYPFEADRARGLNGYCDYLIVRSAEFYYLRSPLVAVVEAKKEDVIGGLGQCAATMVGIRVFNERDGKVPPAVFGCVSSGNMWRFLRLESSRLLIDRQEYYLRDIGALLGILVRIMSGVESPEETGQQAA